MACLLVIGRDAASFFTDTHFTSKAVTWCTRYCGVSGLATYYGCDLKKRAFTFWRSLVLQPPNRHTPYKISHLPDCPSTCPGLPHGIRDAYSGAFAAPPAAQHRTNGWGNAIGARLGPKVRQDASSLSGLHMAPKRRLSSFGGAASDADDVECVVIGAGIIGLAVARALALRGREVVVLEAAGAVGTETSSRHSEVIHAGIYYPLGSLKARMCVEGKMRLYDFCRTHNVPQKNLTKLIVATSMDQLPDLDAFRASAARQGVADLQLLSGAEARALEPALRCEGALLSPSTGILDSHTYMEALLAEARTHGAILALNTRVVGGWLEPPPVGSPNAAAAACPLPARPQPASCSPLFSPPPAPPPAPSTAAVPTAPVGGVPYKVLELHSRASPGGGSGGGAAGAGFPAGGPGPGVGGAVEVSRLRARWVVNAAGLHAVRVAASMAGLPRSSIPTLHLAKGNYFSLAGRCPFSRLIYPMPERGLAGLGTHLTIDMGGAAKFGPDVEWLAGSGAEPCAPEAVDYRVDPRRAQSFYPAIRRFYPGLPDGALQPSYSGVRPKLSGPGEPPADFMVQGAQQGHGVRGWVNLYGIESPGLTSSLALAEYVCRVLDGAAEG